MDTRPEPKLKEALTIGSLWKSLKTGNVYEIVYMSIREEDLETLVNYRAAANPNGVIWTRPLDSFKQRFTLV